MFKKEDKKDRLAKFATSCRNAGAGTSCLSEVRRRPFHLMCYFYRTFWTSSYRYWRKKGWRSL